MERANNYRQARERMVRQQLESRGIQNEKILDVFRAVPRHLFVPQEHGDRAYGDFPLPIGCEQTISQPYMVALMTELLNPREDEVVLEIGTGSGYQTAILAELAQTVYTVERHGDLLGQAKERLRRLGYDNVWYAEKDGTTGWKEHCPYRKILGTGGIPDIPDALIRQLKDPGRLVIPKGKRRSQQLIVLDLFEGEIQEKENISCCFVPLIGQEGW